MTEIILNNDPYDVRLVPGNIIPEPACGSCAFYDGSRCTREWNNLDESFYIPERDDRETCECCDCYEWDDETIKEEER